MHYDFDVVRIVRTLKNVSTAMQAFLSEPNKLYLRYGANNIIQTSSDEERFMREWNKEDKYLDLSPDEEDDKLSLRAMVVDKKLPRDYNAPMIGEQIIQKSFAVKTSNLKMNFAEKANQDPDESNLALTKEILHLQIKHFKDDQINSKSKFEKKISPKPDQVIDIESDDGFQRSDANYDTPKTGKLITLNDDTIV